jgi:hypothetical protein
VLRGAGVGGSPRRAALILAVVVAVSGLVASAVLFAAAARKNAQIEALRRDGAHVEVTVSGCLGLLGGSGSNAAGYACRGTYVFDGRRFEEALPGDELRAPGSKVAAIVAKGDPSLLTTADVLRTEHSSWRPYLVPVVLVVADLLLGAAAVVLRRRSARSTTRRPDGGEKAQAGGV